MLTRGLVRLTSWRMRQVATTSADVKASALRGRLQAKRRRSGTTDALHVWGVETSYRAKMVAKIAAARQRCVGRVHDRLQAAMCNAFGRWRGEARRLAQRQHWLRCQLWYMEELQQSIENHQKGLHRSKPPLKRLLAMGIEASAIDRLDADASLSVRISMCTCICTSYASAYVHMPLDADASLSVPRALRIMSSGSLTHSLTY